MLSFKRVISHAGACVLGLVAGAAIFRLPSWACGPLRWDLLPVWGAAVATFWAVVVALRGGRQAIENAKYLREQDVEHAGTRRKEQAAVVAAIAVPIFYNLATISFLVEHMLEDARFDLDEIYTVSLTIPSSSFSQIESRLDLFEHADAVAFALSTANASVLVNAVKLNLEIKRDWNSSTTKFARADNLQLVRSVAKYALTAYERASTLARMSADVASPREKGRESFEERVRLRMGG